MRFRLTIFLLLANAALFFGIWSLERQRSPDADRQQESVAFTVLEIEGKSIEKPRVLKLENNKWRIVSPIDWPANLFAVNRIKNQLEFMDKEANFSLDEVQKHGHSLAEYGLDEPAYIFKYGNGEKMYTLKIGKSAPVGNRIYMLDENLRRIIVVDKEFVESLVVDMERLRNQMVFEIPRFEVSAFSVRQSPDNADGLGKNNFRRIGLLRDGGKWKFETPIVADADPREVDAFLNEVCQLSARSFSVSPSDNTGFDISTLPTTITLQGTNRRQVLLLGKKTKDGTQVYARLENTPTVFTLDASLLDNIQKMEATLRDKSFLRFDVDQTVGIDISQNGKSLKLRKLKTGVWDVIGSSKDGGTLTAKADMALVTSLLNRIKDVRARQFVNDAPGADLSAYGITPAALHIVATQSDQESHSIAIGSTYKYGGANLMYAAADGSDSVYGIPLELAQSASTDFLFYRSRILEVLPEKSIVKSLKITRLRGDVADVIFDIKSEDGDFKSALSNQTPRRISAANTMLEMCRKFIVKNYLDAQFSQGGVEIDSNKYPWVYLMDADVELVGTDGVAASEKLKWYFSRRVGGTTQYGGNEKSNAVYTVTDKCIDAFFELTQEANPPKSVEKPAVAPIQTESK